MTMDAARSARLIPVVLAPFLILTLLIGAISDGVYHDDDLTHFLMARWAWSFPSYLLHTWGRPGLTLPLASVTWLEDANVAWHAARALSAVATALSALIAARLALRLKIPRPHLVVGFCYLQPLAALLAATTLCENFAALYLVSAVALFMSNRPVAASLLLSLVLVTRHEAIVFFPVWYAAILLLKISSSRKFAALLACVAAPLLHNVLYFLVFERWPLAIFLRPHGSSEYPAAGLLSYVPDALNAMSPAITALAVIGAMAWMRQGRALVPALAGIFLLTHMAIKGFGVFASGGYGRFLVTIAPLVAMLAATGWDELYARMTKPNQSTRLWRIFVGVWLIGWAALEQQRHAGRFDFDASTWWSIRAAAAAMVILCLWMMPKDRSVWSLRAGTSVIGLTCLAQWFVVVGPLRESEQQRAVRVIVSWLQTAELDREPIFAANPWFAHYLGLVENPRAHKGPALLASMPVGTVYLWDSIYSGSDFHRLPRPDDESSPEYKLLRIFYNEGVRPMEIWAFRKTEPTPIPDAPDAPYPPNLAAEAHPVRGIYYLRPATDSSCFSGSDSDAYAERVPQPRHQNKSASPAPAR